MGAGGAPLAPQCLHWRQQQSTGLLHINGVDSRFYIKKENYPGGWFSFLEQGTGVEPAQSAWEAEILPIN